MKKSIKMDNASPFDAIMGTHRSPSTLDVISMCYKADRMIKASEFHREERARLEDINKDLDAILEQIDWLWGSEESASTEDDKHLYTTDIENLLSLYDEIHAAYGLSKPRKPPPPTIGELLYVPIVYLAQILLNIALYFIFTAIMIVFLAVAVFLFFKTL